jgi:CheY-like chemotaxis protein
MDPLPAGGGPGTARQSPTILLVEDDLATSDALTEFLAGEGFAAVAAANGAEAMELLRRGFDPVAIVLDLMMPVMDGWQFRKEQKLHPDIADIPLVVITATGKRPVLVDAAELVMKPLDLNRLFEAVQRYCD